MDEQKTVSSGTNLIVEENQGRKGLFFELGTLRGLDLCAFYIMLAAILCVFLNSSLQVITGPILAICFTFLYFNGYQALVTAIIITANDSLGCIILGSVSFPYLLLALLVVSVFFDNFVVQIRRSQMIAGAILLIMLITLLYYDTISMKNIIYTLTFIAAAGYNLNEYEKVEQFFKGVAITVFLISIHTCITGGVEFYELNEYSTAYLRKGILGVGIGDSNYSSLLLNIGIACALFDKDFKWYLKLIMILCAAFAMTVTLSTSGLIGLLLTLLAFLIVRRNSFPRKVWNVIIVVLGIVFLFNTYTGLPDNMRNETVDAYIERVEEKVGFLEAGDMSEFTTDRSDLVDDSMDYILYQEGIFGQLFGLNSLFSGNSENVPHNTYIGLLLQIGLVGFCCAMGYMIYSGVLVLRDSQRSRRDILLKILFLYYFMNLSLYQGSIFALAYIVMIIL